MRVELVEHGRLGEACFGDAVTELFVRYVFDRRPEERSLAVIDGSRVQGIAVSGRSFGLYEACSHWVFAKTPDAAHLLAERLATEPSFSINFQLQYYHVFQRVFGKSRISFDRLYVLIPSLLTRDVAERRIVRLNRQILGGLSLDRAFRDTLGIVEEFSDDVPFYGIIEGDALLSICEALVDFGGVAAIQQVFTIPWRRGEGLGKDLVTFLSKRLVEEGKIVSYLVSEENLPSMRVAEATGFELHSRWGFVSD